MSLTYLTTAELSGRIKYDSRTIRDHLKDSVLFRSDSVGRAGATDRLVELVESLLERATP